MKAATTNHLTMRNYGRVVIALRRGCGFWASVIKTTGQQEEII